LPLDGDPDPQPCFLLLFVGLISKQFLGCTTLVASQVENEEAPRVEEANMLPQEPLANTVEPDIGKAFSSGSEAFKKNV
jgi:hypothetical protein